MREITRFVVYCWQSWALWQKALILNILLQIVSWLFTAELQTWVSGLGWMILITVMVHWWYRNMLLAKWHKYKLHRNELLTTIKKSHQ